MASDRDHMNNGSGRSSSSAKVPPYSVQAERSVLGAIMLDNRAWDNIADLLSAEDFYQIEHRLIYEAMRHLAERQQPFDVLTLSEWLNQQQNLDRVGGDAFLYELVQNTPTAANVVSYAGIVREKSIFRSLIAAGTDIANYAFNPDGMESKEILDLAEQQVFRIANQQATGNGPIKIDKLLAETTETIDELFHSGGVITGLSTGFTDFDKMTSGFRPGDLVIIAGRPSMGKTVLGVNIAESAAVNKKSVLIFSLEMPCEQITMRLLSSLGRIEQHKIRTGQLKDDDWPRLTSAVSMLSETNLYVDDTPALSPIEVRARARRVAREVGGLDLIVIDYLQLMTLGSKVESRTVEVSEISRSLKALAKELEVPVIALSQLNRSLETRVDKRPVMSDLRESGSIEQDADMIAFIYRDEVYNEDSPDKGKAEIIIRKQRNGPIGEFYLTFQGQFTRFDDYASAQVEHGEFA